MLPYLCAHAVLVRLVWLGTGSTYLYKSYMFWSGLQRPAPPAVEVGVSLLPKQQHNPYGSKIKPPGTPRLSPWFQLPGL